MFGTHRETEQVLGLEEGSLQWRGPFDPQNDPLWRDMQSGKISERDYWQTRSRETGRLLGEDWNSMQDFVVRARSGNAMQIMRPETLAVITAVKEAGMKLAILSNELDLFYGADLRRTLPFLDDFDLIVDATYTDILKPDPRAYAFVTDGLGMAARDCVFVDDQMKNIKGGIAAGMKTVHFDVKKPAASSAQALELLNITNLPEVLQNAA